MKRTYLTLILACAALAGFSQQKIDTTIRVVPTQAEIWLIHNQVQQAIQRIHTLDISSRKRDTIDANLGYVLQVIEQKYQLEAEKKKVAKKP